MFNYMTDLSTVEINLDETRTIKVQSKYFCLSLEPYHRFILNFVIFKLVFRCCST